jgi:hypothetical protein
MIHLVSKKYGDLFLFYLRVVIQIWISKAWFTSIFGGEKKSTSCLIKLKVQVLKAKGCKTVWLMVVITVINTTYVHQNLLTTLCFSVVQFTCIPAQVIYSHSMNRIGFLLVKEALIILQSSFFLRAWTAKTMNHFAYRKWRPSELCWLPQNHKVR